MKTYNPNKDLKMIANEISRQAAADSYRQYYDKSYDTIVGRQLNGTPIIGGGHRAEFTIGALKLRCEDTPQAIAKLSARYTKGAGTRLDSGTIAQIRARERGTWHSSHGTLADVEHEELPA